MIFSKGSGVTNSIFGKSQEPIKAFLTEMEEAFKAKSLIQHIYQMDKTSNFAEKYGGETALGDFEPVGENGAYPKTTFREGYSKVIEPDTWKLQFSLTQEMIEDGKIGKAIKQRGGLFITSYGRTKEKFAAEILRHGIMPTMTFGKKTFDLTGADGLPLFHEEHPSITDEDLVQSNLYDLPFSYDNLSMAEEIMQNFKDDDGNLLNLQPDTIIIPNKARIKAKVFEILNADGRPDSNGDNNGNYHFGRWNVLVWTYLNNPPGVGHGDDWWILADQSWNQLYGGLIWLDRIPLTVKSWVDNNNDANVFNGRSRYTAAPVNWRGFLACISGMGTFVDGYSDDDK